jgi:hypothetical protein
MLRQFGALLAALGVLVAVTRGSWLLPAALLAVGIIGVLWPRLLRPVYVGWMVLAFPAAWLASRLVLAVLFYAVVTPVALFSRLAGRDPLALRPSAADTYWQAREQTVDPASYLRPY